MDTESAPLLAPAAPLAVWRTLIEAMLHAVWLVDARELRIVAANRPAGLLMDAAAESLLGKEVIELVATPAPTARVCRCCGE